MPQNVVQAVKSNPWKTALAVIPVLIAVIYFAVDVRSVIVTQADLQNVKNEIINELRDESAKIRVAYLHDLQARLEDVEIEMEQLDDLNQPVPEALRRKAKRLQRRIEEISEG
jgi:hypothetical protein